MLKKLEELLAKLRAGQLGDGEIGKILAQFVHSPAVALIVGLTPNKADDAVLEILKSIVPKPA